MEAAIVKVRMTSVQPVGTAGDLRWKFRLQSPTGKFRAAFFRLSCLNMIAGSPTSWGDNPSDEWTLQKTMALL